jgi:hypothetical protein
MRLYILKLKNKPLYFTARLTHAILLDLDRFLHPAKHKKKHAHHDFLHQVALAREHCTYDNPAYALAIQQLENLAAHLERIRFDAHGRAAQGDEFIRYSFFLLHEALEIIYRNLIALRRRPPFPDIRIISNHARKNLQLARRQAAMDDADFIGNLKFDSIYISLGKCFDCLEKYFEALSGIR